VAVGRDHCLLLTGEKEGEGGREGGWVYGWGRNQKRQAHYACPCEGTKGDLLQPVLVPLFEVGGEEGREGGEGRVEGVYAGYDSSGVVICEPGREEGRGEE